MIRIESFGGGNYRYNFFDFLGNKLSEIKFIKYLPVRRLVLLDLGCGYNARLTGSIRDKFEKSILIDVSINPGLYLKNEVITGDLHSVISKVTDSSVDFCVANNIIEHLSNPELVLTQLKMKMNKSSKIYICVPNWMGKRILELGAFKLNILSFQEMDDHKFYFSKKELWLLLIKSGFKPSSIEIKTIKFGLCTQAVISI